MADIPFPVLNGVNKKLLDLGDGHHAEVVALGGFEGDVTIEGNAVVDTSALEALVGGLDDAAEGDPGAESATMLALLRGILAEMKAQTALLETIAGG